MTSFDGQTPAWYDNFFPYHWGAAPDRSERITRLLTYSYFLRFSLLLWLFLVILPLLDWFTPIGGVTHGMFALELQRNIFFGWPSSSGTLGSTLGPYGFGQFIWVGFYVTLTGWVALLSARIVCAYGEERFHVAPPESFEIRPGRAMSWWTFLGAQAPGLWFLTYTLVVSVIRAGPDYVVSRWLTALLGAVGILIGSAFAFLAWYLTAFFYRLFRAPRTPGNSHAAGTSQVNDADDDASFRSFMLPRLSWNWLREPLKRAAAYDGSRFPVKKKGDQWLSRLRFHAGFRRPGTHEVHSGQSLAMILALLTLVVYVIAGFLTVPVSLREFWNRHPMVFLLWILLAVITLAIPLAQSLHAGKQSVPWVNVVVALFAGGLLFAGLAWGKCPVLDTFLILAIAACWVGAEAAFLLDLYRVPVATAMVLLVVLFSWLFDRDHIYQTIPDHTGFAETQPANPLDLPRGVVARFRCNHPAGQPMIVVTASGGGIHSAAWTATVLDGLEQAFSGYFHENVILMSSVSGGSIATSYWAESYLDGGPFSSGDLVKRTECSSLEAAAWGVLYPDLNHALVWKDLAARLLPLQKFDRGWALTEAFENNRMGELAEGCKWDGKKQQEAAQSYTLANLRKRLVDSGDIPAFAFNTTIANKGSRLLLSNYTLPEAKLPSCPTCPPAMQAAPDFLTRYRLDISLFTVARLSANFPYVSPVAAAQTPNGSAASERLADGGYNENDGVETAIEFLKFAFGVGVPPEQPRQAAAPASICQSSPSSERQRIVLIEIRNSPAPEQPDMPFASAPKKPLLGYLVDQFLAPPNTLLGFWSEAHSLRNQAEFQLLADAAAPHGVDLYHVVFPYIGPVDEVQPLSWHLTAQDKANIRNEWQGYQSAAAALEKCYQDLAKPDLAQPTETCKQFSTVSGAQAAQLSPK